jgi:hypothetical protein
VEVELYLSINEIHIKINSTPAVEMFLILKIKTLASATHVKH